MFNPVVLPQELYAPPPLVERITLTDGGVYDNLGINPLLRTKRNQIDYAIVSDARAASRIGTNLKKLTAAEITTLTRHGGALVEARLRQYAPELPVSSFGTRSSVPPYR